MMAELFDIITTDVDKSSGVTLTEVFSTIASVTTATNLVVGARYEYNMALSSTFDSITKSQIFRFSVDNGVTWHEFWSEPKDKSDTSALTYNFPTNVITVSEPGYITIQGRKEDAGSPSLVVAFADVWIKRIG